jgi:hypothetical protein
VDPSREIPLELLRESKKRCDVDDDNNPARENIPDIQGAKRALVECWPTVEEGRLLQKKMADARNINPSIGNNGELDFA